MCVQPLAYVTHHIDRSQACSCLALPLRVTERLIVIGALGGEKGRVDQCSHEDWVDNAKETTNLMLKRIKRSCEKHNFMVKEHMLARGKIYQPPV